MRKRTIRKLNKAAVFVSAFLMLCPVMNMPVLAAYDADKTVQLTDDEIDDSTLAIGTHLIYISAMDSQIYEIAKQSADDSGQTKIYYKSELENGTWYDITNGGTIADISTKGTPVDRDVIEALHFNYYTMRDGLTYDLNSKLAVDIFDIDDPYDANGFAELSELKSAYMTLKKKTSKSSSDKYIQSLLEDFYKTDLKTKTTDSYDDELEGLQAYYSNIAGQDNMKSRAATVHSVMSSVDAARRAEVFRKLSESSLQVLIKQLNGTSSVSTDDIPEEFTSDPEVDTAAADSLEAVQEAYVTCSNKMLTEGTTAFGKQKYEYVKKLVAAAAAGDQDTCDEYADKLTDLSNIADNQIINEDSESELIDDDLIDKADSEYINALSSGAGSEYQTAYESGSSKSVLDRKLKQKLTETDSFRTEVQFIVKARSSRMSNDKAQKFVEKRLDGISNFENAVKDDAFQSYALQSISSYRKYLTGLLKDLVEKSSEGSEMSKLQKQKDELLLEKQDQLDDNDLAAAKLTDAKIDDINTQMDTLENQLTLVIYSTTSSESEKAAAKANLRSVSVASDIDAVKENILDAINEGDADSVDRNLDGLSSLISGNRDAGMSALTEIKNELTVEAASGDEYASAMSRELEKVKTIIADNSDVLISSLTEDEISSAVSSAFGRTYEELDDSEKIAVLMSLSAYTDETKDETAENFLITKAQNEADAGNIYIYSKLDSESNVFVSVKALSLCTGYRYIFSDTQQKCILKDSGSYYSFKADDSTVKRSAAADAKNSSSGSDELSSPAGFQGCIYIPSDYVSEKFGLTAEYLQKTDYGILATDDMTESAASLTSALEAFAKK